MTNAASSGSPHGNTSTVDAPAAPQRQSLDRLLTEVIVELDPFWEFQRKLQRRLYTFGLRMYFRPKDVWLVFRDFRKLTAEDRRRDILSGQTGPFTRRLIEAVTPPKERESQAYAIFVGDYSIHELSAHLASRFPALPYGALSKLHALRRAQLAFKPQEIIGVVLAAASLVVKTTPKVVVEEWWGAGSYDSFEKWVFYATLGIVAYLLVVMLPTWLQTRRYAKKHAFIASVLDYGVLGSGEP